MSQCLYIYIRMDIQLQKLTQSMHKLSAENEERVPILTYYNIRGLCQPVRNILYYIGVSFKDQRLQRSQEKQVIKNGINVENTFNSGLPYYEDQLVKLSNYISISIYICKRHKKEELLGQDIRKKAKINELMQKYALQMPKVLPFIMQIIMKKKILEQKSQGIILEMLKNLIKQSKFIKFCIKQHKKTDWIFNELTIVDFYFYQICFYLYGFFKKQISRNQNQIFYSFVTFKKKFDDLKLQEKKYVHMTKLFMPFKSQRYRQAVLNSWQGDQQQDLV